MYTVESSADTSTKKEQHKDQHILATLKALQANLASVRLEVEKLRETAISQKVDSIRPSRPGNGVTMGARSPGCQERRRKRKGDSCPHCYLCGGPNTLHASIEVIWETHSGYPAGQGVASPEEEKSHQCSGCLKFDCHTQLLQCSACQSVR